MKKKLIPIILIIFLLLLAVSLFLVLNKKNESDKVLVEKEVFDCDSVNYSRISFFNNSKDRASLNIPESWEGNYRLKEEAGEAVFYHLQEDGGISKIFGISKKEGSEISNVICRKENLKYIINISNLEAMQNYNNIIDPLDCIIKSIKCE